MKHGIIFFVFCFLISVLWFPASGNASCVNPTGNPGELRYYGGFQTLEYCDGASWVAMGPVGDMRTGLLGWWKLDEGSGTSAADSSGNGNTGTLAAAASWTTSGMNNGALTFNGSTQYVTVANPSNFNFDHTSSFSISAWVYRASYNTHDIIVGKVSATGMTGYEIDLPGGTFCNGGGSNGCVLVTLMSNLGGGNAMRVWTGTASVTTGTWQHIVVTYNGNSDISGIHIYINGVDQSLASDLNALSASMTNTNPLLIGSDTGTGNYFHGTIDDARVYNRALRAADVKTLYTSTGPLSGDIQTGLVGYWKLDEGSGTVANDSTGSGNTGTLNGSPLPTWTTSGKFNGAIQFPGSGNQNVSIPSFADNGAQVTYAYWAYVGSSQGTYTTVFQTSAPTASLTNGTGHQVNVAGAGANQFQITHWSGGSYSVVGTITVNVNAWNHIVEVVNGNASTVYLNGAQVLSASGTRATGNEPITLGGDNTTGFNGMIDDFRVYSRALSTSDVLTLYNTYATACASPVGHAGDLLYNATAGAHVPQFCNGSNWIAVGPVPGAGGAGCTSPTGTESDLKYNADKGYMQYCDGAHWIAIGQSYYGPQAGLVAWWKLDEGSGTVANDSTGNGNTGTLTNGPTWTTSGEVNDALTFDGVDDNVSVSSFADNDTNMTYAYWIYIPSSPAQGQYVRAFQTDLAHSAGSNGVDNEINAAGAGSNNIHFNHWSGGVGTAIGNTTVSFDAWHHIVHVASGNNGTIYVDGAQVLSGSAARTTGNQPLTIGAGDSGNHPSFNGKIDDFRVYNRALSASEIWQLYLVTGGQ